MLALVGAAALANIHPHGQMDAAAEVADRARALRQLDIAQDGDLIFRQGRDMVSQLVLSQSSTPQYSHVGVIIKRGSSTMVVHALPKEGGFAGGVVIESLDEYASLENAVSVGVYRVDGMAVGKMGKMREYLLHQVGKPFDDDFSMADDGAMYCTELAVKSYVSADVDLDGRVGYIEVMTILEPVVTPDALSMARGVSRVASL